MAFLPPEGDLTIGFAHPVYALRELFLARGHGARSFQVRSLDELRERAPEADVLVVSGLWRNELMARLPKLRFIQSVSAGTDQFDKAAIAAAGIRLASAQGGNERAVAEHAIALMLALARQIHFARDNQARQYWRPMIGDLTAREDELGGKTLVVVGLGRIGLRLAKLAAAFDMRVVGVRRSAAPQPHAEAVVHPDKLAEAVAQADFVVLTCPLTPETDGLIDARILAAMKPSAFLVNVARGRVVDEVALIDALGNSGIAGAGLDCFHEEPLPAASPFWRMPQVIVTPHSAGETRAYEGRVIDILLDNLHRLEHGEAGLLNQIV
ncbi:D-2-hydroxyacid dehydrogenase [Bosea sp. (in: a-proteobacteria)]|uniref:D-2-hydroxyacid dehydrogenase n=1 Tax=Bosea sp. (in: a-proteobacteria) TaxID=1871050 RepID=UPI00262249DF|nr:D-2-hydroxyacid dehydrogenase [Bosea sp. (in: a-proteobacteria)]MCO5090645.1 D-2-hydroxyacid dehydrogenase [Bosea sp. (in: a-proteobacteria)]